LCFLISLWVIFISTLFGIAFYLSFSIPISTITKILEDKEWDDTFTGTQKIILVAEIWGAGFMISTFFLRLCYLISFLEPLKRELEIIQQNGIRNIEIVRVMNQFILPCVYYLTLYITLPHLISKLILPFFFSPLTQYKIYILSYPSIILLIFIWLITLKLIQFYNYLHDEVYNQTYLATQSLVNNE
jgi:hypothetical protein